MVTTVIFFAIIYILTYIISRQGFYAPAGFLLIAGAFFLYYLRSERLKKPFRIDALFSLSWIGGAGLSCMKLSYLASDWELVTWVVIGLTYVAFIVFFDIFLMLFLKSKIRLSVFEYSNERINSGNNKNGSLSEKHFSDEYYRLIIFVSIVYLTAFAVEVVLLKYIPLFTVDTPHAYSEFHVTGLHYFTVLFALIPGLAVLYFLFAAKEGYITKTRFTVVAIAAFFSIVTPLLLVSRSQLLFSVILGFFTFVSVKDGKPIDLKNKKNLLLVLISVLSLALLYIFITIERAHSAEYLLSIFEIKNNNIPLWIAQPYIYVSNNFDNLNCLVRDLKDYAHGLRQLYPFIALTGMKFIHPELIVSDLYITKTELTTLTFIYDAYYDFGIAGVFFFSVILGTVSAFFESSFFKKASDYYPVFHIIKGQMLFYICFSFFTTWFSNATTWFYLGVSVIILLIQFFTYKKYNILQRSN